MGICFCSYFAGGGLALIVIMRLSSFREILALPGRFDRNPCQTGPSWVSVGTGLPPRSVAASRQEVAQAEVVEAADDPERCLDYSVHGLVEPDRDTSGV